MSRHHFIRENLGHAELLPPTRPRKYRDKRTERFATGERVREFQAFERQAYRRLEILEAATSIEVLMSMPSNHFEALGGNRKGQYSIRINRQWRICFEWPEGESQPFNIEITDYH
jgi:proteic killer suppression protein